MKNILKTIKALVGKIENYPSSFFLWMLSFFGIILVRIICESWVNGFESNSASYVFYNIANTFVFFLFAYLLFLGILSRSLKTNFKKISNIMLWGYLIIIFPPIIDHVIFGNSPYSNFYGIYGLEEIFRRFFTFFGDRPDFGVTYGTRIEIAITVVFVFVYAFLKTSKWVKSLSLAFYSYAILFCLATFPSWLTIIVQGVSKGFLEIGEMDIFQIFMTPAIFFSKEVGNVINALSIKLSLIYSLLITVLGVVGLFLNYREKFLIFLRNIRPVQVIYHLGLLSIGVGLGYKFTAVTWIMLDAFNILSFMNVSLAVISAWLVSVIINDISDEKVDTISNKYRPLVLKKFSQKEYMTIGVILFLASILFSALVNPKIATILVSYQALAWSYSVYPLRLKRVPIVATFISALASLFVLFSGFILVSISNDIVYVPAQIIWLTVITLTLSLPIKDLKDIKGDKSDGVLTIPVIFGEYWGKIIIGSGIFISYILSVVLLHESRLLFPAVLLGGLSFWVVSMSGENKKITHRNVVGWIMALVFVYGLILIQYI